MSSTDPQAALMMMLAAAQQQAMQQQQQQQQQKAASSSGNGAQKASNGAAQNPNQMAAAMAQLNALSNMTPEMMMMWQNAMQTQMLQQMMISKQQQVMAEQMKKAQAAAAAAAKAKKAQEEAKAKKNQTVSMEETLKRMIEEAAKIQQQQQNSGGASSSTSSGKPGKKNVIDQAMWQLVAAQMLQQQQQQQKDQQAKQEQIKKEQEQQKKQRQQQENIVKMLMAQLAAQQMKQKMDSLSGAAGATPSTSQTATEEDGKAKARLPLQLGWRRQTCVRSLTAAGVKGDVTYYAPCGKKLCTYAEVQRYLLKSNISYITRDNFLFTTKLVIGEFVVPKPKDDESGERELVVFTEEDINKEISRLQSLKMPAAKEERPPRRGGVVVEEEPPEELGELNDEFLEETTASGAASASGAGGEENKCREMDDLLLQEIRHLPDLPRIGNQCLDSNGFADALMVHEFVQNFGHVLGIDVEMAPKLESLCAGLAGSAEHSEAVLRLTQHLFQLAMEFPGLSKCDEMFGQGAGEMGVDRENFGELMRMFLAQRGDEKGGRLADTLANRRFERLRGEERAAILAYLCDELVCSRNVIGEIDRNLDELSRLKGEKWMREGKARTLKAVQSKKQNTVEGADPDSDSDGGAASRPNTPPKEPTKEPKKFTPGLGQCEILTAEEEAMTVEEMESCIGELHAEAQQINKKIHDTSLRVRSFPFGTDRFHRQYWLLPHTDAVLVESIGSAAVANPACNVYEVAARDPPPIVTAEYLDEDVVACVEDLVDEVVLSRARADKKQRRRYRRVENRMKRGWWTIESRESLEALRVAMHGRGIRERCLHRLLNKPWFLNDFKYGKITLEPVGDTIDVERIESEGWRRVSRAIRQLEKRMRMSDVVVEAEKDDVAMVKPSVTPIGMALAQIVKEGATWTTYDDEPTESEDVEKIRERIVETARLVDPKFWRPAFANEDGLEKWRTYVRQGATTSGQVMVAVQALEGMVAWERSAREALCQICKSMDGDEMLVCDGCDTGCHMECFRPPLTTVPAGDWYCPRCREQRESRKLCMFCGKDNGKELVMCQRCAYHSHLDCANDGGAKDLATGATSTSASFLCPDCVGVKALRFAKRIMYRGESEERDVAQPPQHGPAGEEETQTTPDENRTPNGAGPTLRSAIAKRKFAPGGDGVALVLPLEMNRELCRMMLDELGAQPGCDPFLTPVDVKTVPGYKEIIKQPIDLNTIRKKNEGFGYETPEEFAADMDLMFLNCRVFNVDDSPVGQAGITLNKFYTKRWKQLKYNFSKRLKRLHRQI